ncbi:hypothetical protein [Sorangium sp. So ce1335]
MLHRDCEARLTEVAVVVEQFHREGNLELVKAFADEAWAATHNDVEGRSQ